ncbi:MAG: HAMP domain-containing sensor histidine kinase [Pseudomonadota bacterium]
MSARDPQRGGVRRRLFYGFAMQVGAISLAVLLGVGATSLVIRGSLLERALLDEAETLTERLQEDPDAAPPHTTNLRAYVLRGPGDAVPDYLTALDDGFHELDDSVPGAIVYVTEREVGRLFLVFQQDYVQSLSLLFGIVPLGLVLLTIYLVTWWTYRMSHRAVSPLVKLARRVENLNLNRLDDAEFDPDSFAKSDDEVYILTNALRQLSGRIQRFVERERNFTRDASHELRTPVTVIQMAADMLLEEGDLAPYQERSVRRIQGVAKDMHALIEALLMLARESGEGMAVKDFCVNDVVSDELDRYEFLVRNKQVRLVQTDRFRMHVLGPPSVLAVMIGNLIRNACAYTNEGDVKVTVGRGFVSVDDSGVGMAEEHVSRVFEPFYRGGRTGKGGHGVGLTIVKRLADRFGWPVEIQSELGVGTCATIYFPEYTVGDDAVVERKAVPPVPAGTSLY